MIDGPAKHATGGGRASSSAAAAAVDRRSSGHRSASFAATNGSRGGGNASGGGGADGGGSHRQPVRTSAGGLKEEGPDAQPQLRQQEDSRAASSRRPTATPPLPTSRMSHSPRFQAGPLRALSPLALFGRIVGSRLPSRSKSSTPRHGQNDRRRSSSISLAGQHDRREEEGTRHNREAMAGAVVGTSSDLSSRKDDTKSKDAGDHYVRDGVEFSHDVASAATAWLASFERRFMPCLVAEAGATATAKGAGVEGARRAAAASTAASNPAGLAGSRGRAEGPEGTKDGVLPAAIARVLHEVNE